MLNNEIKFINKDNNAVIWIDFNNRSVSWSTLTKSTKIIEFVIYHSTSGPPYSLSVPTRLSVGETLRHTDVYNFPLELQSYSLWWRTFEVIYDARSLCWIYKYSTLKTYFGNIYVSFSDYIHRERFRPIENIAVILMQHLFQKKFSIYSLHDK